MRPPKILELIGLAPKGWSDVCIAEPWITVKFGSDVLLFDARVGVDQPAARIPSVATHAINTTDCIAAHTDCTVSRWTRDSQDRWRLTSTLSLPEAWKDSGPVSRIDLSPSGRYLHLHLKKRTLIYELDGWRLVCELNNTGATTQFSFFALPSGRELAYTTLTSYLEVSLFDCATGNLVYQGKSHSAFDVIHTSMRTSADGQWLLANGLVWGDRIEALIYDIREWDERLRGLPNSPNSPAEASVKLPWRRVLRLYPPWLGEDAKLPAPNAVQDGVACVRSTLTGLSDLVEEVEDDEEYLDDESPIEKALALELCTYHPEHNDVTITRWIDLETKEVLRFEIAAGSELPSTYKIPAGRHSEVHRLMNGHVFVVRVWQHNPDA